MTRFDDLMPGSDCKNRIWHLRGRRRPTGGAVTGRIGFTIAITPAGSPVAAQTAAQADQAIAAQNTIQQRFTPPPRLGSVDISVKDQRKRVTDAEAARIRFQLRSMTVAGVVTLHSEALSSIWRDRIGTKISVADLYQIAEAIDAAYLRAGYFSMTVVPVQNFKSGSVSLRVYEGYISSVRITSDIPGIERRLQPYIDRIVAMRPIRIKEAERILSLMSDLGGLEIEGIFIRPEVPSGAGSLELTVGFKRSDGMIGLDSLGTDEVGPLELSSNLAMYDLFGLFETTTLVAVTVPDSPQELALLKASQDFPIGHDGMRIGYSFTYIAAQPGGALKSQDIQTESRIGMAYLSYPLIRSLSSNLLGQIEINAQNDSLDVGGAQLDRSEARWMLASLHYDNGTVSGGIALGQGFGHNFERPDVPSNYRFVTADIDYTRPLGDFTNLRIRAAGQYAGTAIPGANQFALGGDPYGWAFDGGVLSGDSGVGAAFEISRTVDTSLAALPTVSISAIADYGISWNREVEADYDRDTLGSIGFGVSGMLGERMTFQVLAATPWYTGRSVEDRGTRVFFRIGLPL